MDDFVNSQLAAQRKHTEDYYKELDIAPPRDPPKEIKVLKNSDDKVDAVLA